MKISNRRRELIWECLAAWIRGIVIGTAFYYAIVIISARAKGHC